MTFSSASSLKRVRLFLLSLVCAPSLLLGGCFSSDRPELNQTVLTINDREVTTKEFADKLAARLKHHDALTVKDESVVNRVKEEVAQAFVLETIARDYSRKNGISVSKAEIDAKMGEIRANYPDDFSFRRSLAAENLSLEQWREDLEFTLLQKKLFENLTAKLTEPTEAEMKTYYEANKEQFQQNARIRLRQIVLAREDDAKRISDELTRGADFARLAKQYSVAPEGKDGGDTGWIDKGTLEVFDQAFKMSIGARSKILKSPYGFHIYEVLRKEPEARLSFAEAKAKIRARLMETRAQKAFSTWLEGQVRQSTVLRDEAVLRSIKVSTRGS